MAVLWVFEFDLVPDQARGYQSFRGPYLLSVILPWNENRNEITYVAQANVRDS